MSLIVDILYQDDTMATSWRDVTAGDGSIGPKWIPKPELKIYKVVMGGYIRKAVTLGLQGYRIACLQ
jgi:hypothetical protein